MGLGLLYQKDSLSQIEVGPAFKGVDENAYFNPKDKSAGRELTPEKLHAARAAEDPRNIYDDAGQIQDYDLKDYGKRK
jgi:hypothetical protein